MYSKMVIYTLLAVALGYILIEAVPGGLVQEVEVLRAEEGKMPPQEDQEIAGVESFETPKTTERGLLYEVSQYGVWVVNVVIALGVYVVARRRFT